MTKSKIFISSSERTLLLAEKLRDQLADADYCEAVVWKTEVEQRPSETMVELLEDAIQKYDFAVILLAKADLVGTHGGEERKARDNCVFEAGLFMAAIGRKRCILVNSLEKKDLPSDLHGLNLFSFTEPADLTNREQCIRAMQLTSGKIKDMVQRTRGEGSASPDNRRLSMKALFEKETLISEGGDLRMDQVVVTAMVPAEVKYEPARRVRKNIDGNVRYVYFFHGRREGARRICQVLQLVLLAPLFKDSKEADNAERRYELVKNFQPEVEENLRQICQAGSLKVFFLPGEPDEEYCIHNADDPTDARLYMKHDEESYVQWRSGIAAVKFWEAMKRKHGADDPQPEHAVLYGGRGFNVRDGSFYKELKTEVKKFFPGMESQVMKFCLDGPDQEPDDDRTPGSVKGALAVIRQPVGPAPGDGRPAAP